VLLHAACSSPTSRQVLASCTALLLSSRAAPPAGSRIAVEGDLPALVKALRADCPELASVEDFLPLDPRENVRFRARSEVGEWDFRVHPGTFELPLQSLQNFVNYAEAIDPVLVPRLGFGVADMLRLAGRMLDAELSVLAPVWGDAEATQESLPSVTQAEAQAARSYLETWEQGDSPPGWLLQSDDGTHDEGLSRAAEMLTVDYQDLSFDAGLDRVHMGPALLIRGPGGLLPVPSALIIESLMAAVALVLGFASGYREASPNSEERDDSASDGTVGPARITGAEAAGAERRWRERAEADLEWACRALPATSLFGNLVEDTGELQLISPSHRHVVAVDLVTGLNSGDINDSIRAARERLTAFGPGSRFRVSPPKGGIQTGFEHDRAGIPPTGTAAPGLAWLAGIADALPFAESLMSGEPAALAEGTVVTRLVVVDGPWQHAPNWPAEIPACTLDEFRLLLATQDWRSTDREELWSFLDELAALGSDGAGGGYSELICWSVLDAWEAWLAHGMLCPAWVEPGTVGRILQRDLDNAWRRTAFLDPVDAILVGLGMAGAREWSQLVPTPVPAAHPNPDMWSFVITLSVYVPRRIWWVALEMGLVVSVDLEFRDGPAFSRASMATLANTVEDTLRALARSNPQAWQWWRDAHGDHPIAIDIMTAQLPGDRPAFWFVGLGKSNDLFITDPQRLPALQVDDVHMLVGEALASSMLARLQPIPEHEDSQEHLEQGADHAEDRATHATEKEVDPPEPKIIEYAPSEEDLRRTEAFTAAWRGIEPRFSQQVRAIPFGPYGLTSAQTLTGHGRDRASRTVARRFRNRLSAGTHPLSTVLAVLCPGALEALSDAAGSYAPRAALAAACAELERTASDRLATRLDLEMNLDSAWADEALSELDITASSDEAHRSRVAEMLTEHLLSQPPGGSLTPDRRDVHQLLDLAAAALDTSLEAQYAFAALQPAELEVTEYGHVHIARTGPARVDIGGWQLAKLQEQAHGYLSEGAGQADRTGNQASASPPVGGRDPGQRETIRSLLREDARSSTGFRAVNAKGLLAVDDQLIAHCGFGLDSVAAVLGTAASWDVPAEPHPPVAQVSRAAFVDTAATSSGLPREHIDAAVLACTLNREKIQHDGLRYWQLKERSARLALRPLIEPPDAERAGELWLLPRCAHRTQSLLLTYLNSQQLPWPDRDLPETVRQAVTTWHNQAEAQLERELAAAATTAGLPHRLNLKPQKAARLGLRLPGEIDLIAADPARRRIWIVEAKHLRPIYSPLEIGSRIADFHGSKALSLGQGTIEYNQLKSRSFRPYVSRVIANTRAVQENKQAAVRLIGEGPSQVRLNEAIADDWEVVPLIVTTSVEVSAFAADPAVTFVLVDHLATLFAASEQPPLGWWLPQLA
jgi:hypothetical protein